MSSHVSAIMRGGPATPEILVEVHKLTRIFPHEALQGLNRFITKHCFALDTSDYGTALRFTGKQIEQLDELLRVGPGVTEENWFYLAVAYILENIERVQRWIDFDKVASGLLIRQNPDAIIGALLDLPPIDQQSMFSMRIYASLHAYSDTAIREYVNSNLTSKWFKGRLLYPLIFDAINLPTHVALAQMLDHLVPADKFGRSERQLISFLLRPQEAVDVPLSYRCYVGMMGHPYDALEYITQHLEAAAAQRRGVSDRVGTLMDALGAAFPDHRIAKLAKMHAGYRFEIVAAPAPGFETVAGDPVSTELAQLMDAKRSAPDIQNDYPVMVALRSLRWNSYPVKADYDLISVYRLRFAMLSAGVFIDWFARSLFLFERDSYPVEELWLFRGALMCNGLPPLLMMGPHGPAAIDGWSNALAPGASTVRTSVEEAFGDGKRRSDRLWISASNWSIAQHQQQGRIPETARDQTLTLQEIYLAVQQRFQTKGKSGRIVFGSLPSAYTGRVVSPDHIRHMYDLLSELVQNAVKHSGCQVVRLRFTPVKAGGHEALAISNPTNSGAVDSLEITGHPYQTVHDTLFGEGHTGCKKVAYLAASIARRPISTFVEGRQRSFHVAVPLEL
ncbi:MAG TPA: hypothetical protein VMU59_10930 [Caulobacteraceae bacterium]|nr:hypothetical protein [Caulobacteraceae bacterium]